MGQFTSSFQILISFLSYYHLNALARTDGTVLSGTSDSGHPVSFLMLEEKLSTLSPWYGVGFINDHLCPLSSWYGPSIHNLSKVFMMNRCWILSNVFYTSIKVIIWNFFFSFIKVLKNCINNSKVLICTVCSGMPRLTGWRKPPLTNLLVWIW